MCSQYFYKLDPQGAIKLTHVSLEYDNEVDCHHLKVMAGDKEVLVEVFPEELAEIYEDTLGENLKRKIYHAIS